MKRIGLGLAIAVARALLIFVVGMGILGPMLTGGEVDPGSPGGSAVVLVLLVLDAVLTVGLGLLFLGKVELRSLGWRFDDPVGDVARGVIGFALCACAVLAGILVATGTIPFADVKEGIAQTPLAVRMLVIAIGIVAAFVEESLYRGYLQSALVEKTGLVPGIVVTAILFDVLHLNFRPASLVAKLGIGLVLGVLRGRDRSLLAPAIAHGLVWAVFGLT